MGRRWTASPLLLWERGQLAAAVEGTGARRSTSFESGASRTAGSTSSRPARFRPRRRVLVTDKVELSARAQDFLQAAFAEIAVDAGAP